MNNEIITSTESPINDMALKKFFFSGTPKDDVSLPSLAETQSNTEETGSVISSLSDCDLAPSFRIKQWDRQTRYSDMISQGLEYLKRNNDNVVMLFESPSTSCQETSFFNSQVYKFHDYPPSSARSKGVLGPCRYAVMNGAAYPVYLRDGAPPTGLVNHWESAIPSFVHPTFVPEIVDEHQVYAYLPVESIKQHVNDPHVHYHMAGKDAISLMTKKTTKLLPNTRQQRPCVVKTTHSMGGKGIFIIRNDEDEAEFNRFIVEAGNPTYVITEFVEIARNVACHFFIHPNGDVTWIGSNENLFNPATGGFSSDSYLNGPEQEYLRNIQLPYVRDVVKYCLTLGFWGFCGVDVLFDKNGKGYLVDVNPRLTGSCPSLMVLQLLKDKYGFEYGLFRRSKDIFFLGSSAELFASVQEFNEQNEGQCRVVVFSSFEETPTITKVNMGVYSNSMELNKSVLNQFARPKSETGLEVPATVA